MGDIHFSDNSFQVKRALDSALDAYLEEAAGEIEAQTKRNSPVDTGQLKGSWQHKVSKLKKEGTIGSPIENAIWNEFGTGQYALKGNGRKTPWVYQSANGNWYTTKGKKPQRSLFKAMEKIKPKLERILKSKIKGAGL